MTYYDLYKQVAGVISKVSECSDFEAKCLIEHFYGVTPNDIYAEKECEREEFFALNEAVEERLNHFPLQYIIGKWQFMDYEFIVDENVLIPRPETELLCECLEKEISADNNCVVYDLCAGSGCVGISVSKMCGAEVVAVEKYSNAFQVLKKNIAYNGANKVVPVQYDILNKPNSSFQKADFILSNPPYIDENDMKALQAEVKKEPETALFGGNDGLKFYRAISENWLDILNDGGYVAMEIGEGQQEDVIKIFSKLTYIKTINDYNSIQRVVVFKKGK